MRNSRNIALCDEWNQKEISPASSQLKNPEVIRGIRENETCTGRKVRYSTEPKQVNHGKEAIVERGAMLLSDVVDFKGGWNCDEGTITSMS